MKAKWLDRALFVSSHYFTLCTTEKMFNKELKRLKVPKKDWPPFVNTWHSNATCHYFEKSEKNRMLAIVCVPVRKDVELIGIHALLCHEAVHIWQQVREAYGESRPSSELEAYAIQNLAQELMTEYARQTK